MKDMRIHLKSFELMPPIARGSETLRPSRQNASYSLDLQFISKPSRLKWNELWSQPLRRKIASGDFGTTTRARPIGPHVLFWNMTIP